MLWTVDVKTKLSIVACISYGNNFARKLYPKLVVFEQLANICLSAYIIHSRLRVRLLQNKYVRLFV